MGLHHTAHYLRSKGRGNDTMLVHMTPGEVKGLQALALRHGGSLTINPDTGLPEAGFLEQILPVVAAAGLTYLTAGAAAPTLTAALGGSSLAGGIAAGALSGAAISGGMAAIQGKNAGQAALMGGLGGGIAGGMGAYDAANVFNAPNLLADASQKMATATPDVAVEMAKQSFPVVSPAGNALSIPNPAGPGFISSETGQLVATAPSGSGLTAGEMMAGSVRPGPVPPVSAADAAQAAKTIGSSGSVTGSAPTTFYQDQGTIGRMAIQGLPAIGLLEDEQQGAGPTDTYQSPLRRISPDFRAYEPPRPNPYYSATYPRYAAEGGIMQSYQAGGPVERMSQMNTAMNPQGGLYPQGMIDKTQYATPTQRPVSSELVEAAPAYERSSPMLMAEGGEVKGYAAGGMPDLGPGFSFGNLKPYTASLDQENAAIAFNQANNIQTAGRTMSKAMPPEMQRVQGGGYDEQGRAVDGLGNVINSSRQPQSLNSALNNLQNMIAQPTGQSTFPGAASMQGGFGQGAPGYPSLTMNSGGGGASGAFPLEGRYGIVKMNVGGVARPLPKGDAGLYRDTDPTTRSQDAFTAAMTRLGSMQKKANIKGLPGVKAAAKPLGNIEEAASGGIMSSIGGYSDGGRMLKGPGDGMSDSIPGIIGGKQPARLADGEFVVPADVVSHLGNGSTDAGARKLYKMMDKIRKARTGKKKQAPAVKADRYMPA
jgi:hypothetical protein